LQEKCYVKHTLGGSGVPRNFFRWWLMQEFFWEWVGCSTNSVEDRGQRQWGSGGCSPLVRGSTQFANEWNPYSDDVVTDVFLTELGIRLSFVKTSEFRGRVWTPPPVRHCFEVHRGGWRLILGCFSEKLILMNYIWTELAQEMPVVMNSHLDYVASSSLVFLWSYKYFYFYIVGNWTLLEGDLFSLAPFYGPVVLCTCLFIFIEHGGHITGWILICVCLPWTGFGTKSSWCPGVMWYTTLQFAGVWDAAYISTFLPSITHAHSHQWYILSVIYLTSSSMLLFLLIFPLILFDHYDSVSEQWSLWCKYIRCEECFLWGHQSHLSTEFHVLFRNL
jgi:hypothetical protein